MGKFFLMMVIGFSCVTASLCATPAGPVTVKMDGAGNLLAFWQETDTTIVAAVKPAGMAWEDPVVISNVLIDNSQPIGALSRLGHAVVGFVHFDDVNLIDTSYVVEYDFATDSWTMPQQLSAATDEEVESLLFVDIDENDDAFVSWQSFIISESDTKIFVSTSTFGGAWSAPSLLLEF